MITPEKMFSFYRSNFLNKSVIRYLDPKTRLLIVDRGRGLLDCGSPTNNKTDIRVIATERSHYRNKTVPILTCMRYHYSTYGTSWGVLMVKCKGRRHKSPGIIYTFKK